MLDKIIFTIILLAIIATPAFIAYYLRKHKYITDKQLNILTFASQIVAIVALIILYFIESETQASKRFISIPILIIFTAIGLISAIKTLRIHKYITDKQLVIFTITAQIVAIVVMTILYFTELLLKAQTDRSFLSFIATPIVILILIISAFSNINKLRK